MAGLSLDSELGVSAPLESGVMRSMIDLHAGRVNAASGTSFLEHYALAIDRPPQSTRRRLTSCRGFMPRHVEQADDIRVC